MSDTLPLVSIVMPVYNTEKYIEEAIQSVLMQTYKHWELIVIDDGSTDNTRSIIDTFKDERMQVISQENAGVSVARNRGLDIANGKYITFVDADDVLPDESLEVRVFFLEQHPLIDIVDGKILVKDSEMNETLRRYVPYYNGKLLQKLLALDSRVFFNVCYMFRAEKLNNLCFKPNMTHAEDLLFYMQLASKGDVVYGFVSEVVYKYRSGHASSMSNLYGLENGYRTLLSEMKKDENISNIKYLLLKVKIVKIMFLSWYGKSQIKQAYLSVYKMLWV